jgi:hypothetical protein
VAHRKNLCILFSKEDVSETESLASLLCKSRYPLQTNQIRETVKLKAVPETVIHVDIPLCGGRNASPDFISGTA